MLIHPFRVFGTHSYNDMKPEIPNSLDGVIAIIKEILETVVATD